MSVSGERIRRLADIAAGAPDAESALRAMTQLRDELEELERQQVAQVLAEGGSFADVARALGITRQAAHRRFKDLAPARRRRPTPRPPAGPELRMVLAYARAEALALRAPVVEPQHLLLGILRNGDRRVAAALEAAGVTLEVARREALEAAGGPGRRQFRAAAGGGETAGRAVLADAVRRAVRDRAEHVTVEHLLRAILDAEGEFVSLLSWLGVPHVRVLGALDADRPVAGAAAAAAAG